jgi:hypothetical protein
MIDKEIGHSDSDSAAKSGAARSSVDSHGGATDPDLASLETAWPTLPEATRRAILALVRGEPV